MTNSQTKPMSEGAFGFLIVDKPIGMTSHQVVGRFRKVFGTRRVGHSGTLDPDASGVLVCAIGSVTRLLVYLLGADKTYRTTVVLGIETDTEDAAGEVLRRAEPEQVEAVTAQQVTETLAGFTGNIDQVPSAVSAIKQRGKRSYQRVRAGEKVHLDARPVRIERLEQVTPLTHGRFDIEVDCSSGTYIRALGRDIGHALKVGAHITNLRRLRLGDFGIAEATPLDTITAETPLLDPAKVLRRIMPCVPVDTEQAKRISRGVQMPLGDFPPLPAPVINGHIGGVDPDAYYAAISIPDEQLVAVVVPREYRGPGPLNGEQVLQPVTVLPHSETE